MCGVFGRIESGSHVLGGHVLGAGHDFGAGRDSRTEPGATGDALASMAEALAHRGPDGGGVHRDPRHGVALGCCRLAIVDPAGGDQPMSNEDGSIWLVFNGEIYDHRSLRRQLESRGHRFSSACDSEVVLHLYEEEGLSAVEALRGMFAFALWDDRRRRLLLARDALGQKPLYYRRCAGGLLFASEVKAILAAGDFEREIDPAALWHHLSLRWVPPPSTLLRGIEKLPPAHLATWHEGTLEVRPYWRPRFVPKHRGSGGELLAAVRARLVEAVDSHLAADVPVGLLLSGGLDSSMVAAVAARELGHRPPAFVVGVGDGGFDERPWARQVARHLGLELHESVVEPDLVRQLPRTVWHLDEPSDPIAGCMERAAELASRHVKVVLGGDGGDEVFAGFDRYWGVGRAAAFARLPEIVRRRLIAPLLDRVGESFAYKSWTQKARWLERLAREDDPAERYAAATLFFRFDRGQKEALIGDAWPGGPPREDSRQRIAEPYRRAAAEHALDRMLASDLHTRLSEHSLMLTDRASMAHGIEQRAPLLDRPLVELMATAPVEQKVRGRRLKVLLRALARDLLPREVVERPKQGFMFPLAAWLRGPLFGFARRALTGGELVAAGWLRRPAVERLLGEHRRRRRDHHARLWMLLNLEIWYRLFILARPLEVVEHEVDLLLAEGEG